VLVNNTENEQQENEQQENEQQENEQHKVDMEEQTSAEDVTTGSTVEEAPGDHGVEESGGAGDTSQAEVDAEEGHAGESKQEALMEMYEESIRRVQVGEVVQGKIVQVGSRRRV